MSELGYIFVRGHFCLWKDVIKRGFTRLAYFLVFAERWMFLCSTWVPPEQQTLWVWGRRWLVWWWRLCLAVRWWPRGGGASLPARSTPGSLSPSGTEPHHATSPCEARGSWGGDQRGVVSITGDAFLTNKKWEYYPKTWTIAKMQNKHKC